MQHKLKKAYQFEGKEYSEIDINLEDFSTENYEKVERDFKILHPAFSGSLENDSRFIKLAIQTLAGLPHGFFNKLPAHEFVQMKYKVQTFLLTGSITESMDFAELV